MRIFIPLLLILIAGCSTVQPEFEPPPSHDEPYSEPAVQPKPTNPYAVEAERLKTELAEKIKECSFISDSLLSQLCLMSAYIENDLEIFGEDDPCDNLSTIEYGGQAISLADDCRKEVEYMDGLFNWEHNPYACSPEAAYKPQYLPDACGLLYGYLKDKCLIYRAMDSADAGLCDEISFRWSTDSPNHPHVAEYRNNCLMAVTAVTKNASVCRIPDIFPYNSDDCRMCAMIQDMEEDDCFNPFYLDKCYVNLAIYRKDPAFCKLVNGSLFTTEECLAFLR